MSMQTLNRVTLDTLDNYGRAATQAVAAYRLGGRRLVAAVDGAIAKMTPAVPDRVSQAREEMAARMGKGIDGVAHRSDQVIERSQKAAVASVEKVAQLAAGVTRPTLANGLAAVARLTMPGAQVALALSGKVAQGADALVDAVAGTPAKAPRRAKKSVKAVKAVEAVKAAARHAPVVAKRAVRKAKAEATALVAAAEEAKAPVRTARRRATKATPLPI